MGGLTCIRNAIRQGHPAVQVLTCTQTLLSPWHPSAHLGVSVTGSAGLLSSATPRTSLPFCTRRYALSVLGSAAAPAAWAVARAASRRAAGRAAGGSGAGTALAGATAAAVSRCRGAEGATLRWRPAARGAALAGRLKPCWAPSAPAPVEATQIMLASLWMPATAKGRPCPRHPAGPWGFSRGRGSHPAIRPHKLDREDGE